MITARQRTGQAGEDNICTRLVELGWRIVARNWRTRRGEIDIIGLDKDSLVFVEVKTWPHGRFEDLEMVINAGKQKRMVELAKQFLCNRAEYGDRYIRFDVILLEGNPEDNPRCMYHHIKNAFSECV